MKIITWNVNGIRSVNKKGFLEWFKKADADIMCLQELKAQEADLPGELKNIPGYFSYFNCASSKKGYSGVGVYTKTKPEKVDSENGLERFDAEGRILELTFNDFKLINVYIPHGGRQKENLEYKLEVYEKLIDYLKKHQKESIVIAGDMNIAHEEIDLARPKNNKNNIMFTPEERSQIDTIIDLGYSDSFRKFHQDGGHYTWWPWLANARERNLGWRIDYIFTSKSLEGKIKSADILADVFGSDHCPTEILIEI